MRQLPLTFTAKCPFRSEFMEIQAGKFIWRAQVATISISTPPAASRLSSAINHQMSSSSSAACGVKMERRIHPCGFSRSVRRWRNISIAASPSINRLGLSKTFLNMGSDGFALFKHPLLQIELPGGLSQRPDRSSPYRRRTEYWRPETHAALLAADFDPTRAIPQSVGLVSLGRGAERVTMCSRG
jgi:hypothetical protein